MPQPPVILDTSDVLGIGFGPSNLALAVALAEHNEHVRPAERIEGRFLERQSRFTWHRGMLVEGSNMRTHFLKDMVTMRNPTSRHSFLCYLQEKGRLFDFVNHRTAFTSRAEFHDYLDWVADRFSHVVGYDREVTEVCPVHRGDEIVAFDLFASGAGGASVHRARNLVIAVGLRPYLPPGLPASERIWHNHELLPRLAELSDQPVRRFVVIGAGQSAAETTDHLHRRFPGAEVCSLFARFGYSPADDSPFANRLYAPDAVDEHFAAPEEVRRMLLDYHANTNYSVADLDLIEELYRRAYQEKITGRHRLRMLNVSQVCDVRSSGGDVAVSVRSLATDSVTVLHADVVVFATGYRSQPPLELLGALAEECLIDGAGRVRIERDYRVATTQRVRGAIYVQGATEHSHGVSSTVLSNVAVRTGEIVESLAGRRSDRKRGDCDDQPVRRPRRPVLRVGQ